MDFAKFVKEKQLLSDNSITELTNNYTSKRHTFFEELYLEGNHYGVDHKTLFNWAVNCAENSLYVVDSMRSCEVKVDDFNRLDGIAACMKRNVMFVRVKGVVVALTRRPDDPGLPVLLNKNFGQGKYVIGVCLPAVWDSIYSLLVEPLLIEEQATSLARSEGFAKQEQSKMLDSEARMIYNHVLMLGIQRGASDVHLIPGSKETDVLYRIDGVNYKLMSIPLSISDRFANLLTIDGSVQKKGPNTPLDGKIRYYPVEPSKLETMSDEDKDRIARDLRFSILPARRNHSDTNVRYLNTKLYTFEELGMSPDNAEKFRHILSMPQGLIMQVGPTGSGKSTTLYAGLRYIHSVSLRNIITAEDPVEIAMDGITQVETVDEAGLDFAKISRQFLRHDVDVGVIGEIRDDETAVEAVRAATTGHLVISSLHTNDSLGVIERLQRLGIDSYTLSEVLVAIMGQRLVRRLCPYCKQEYVVEPDDMDIKKFNFKDFKEPHKFYRAVGCEKCKNLGYSGRVAVNEILILDSTLRDMVQRHETRLNMEDYLRKSEFKTMYADALDKAWDGITSVEELLPMRNDTLAFK